MKIKKGDIILVRSYNFSARLIHFGMNVRKWRKLQFKPFWKKIHNHAAICTEDEIIAEALSKGVTIHKFEDAYPVGSNVEILVYRPDWTTEELKNIKDIASNYNKVKYQFVNFIQYIPEILFGIWIGDTHKKAQDEIYCTELVALICNKLRSNLFIKYWRTSPNDIGDYCIKNYKLIGVYKR